MVDNELLQAINEMFDVKLKQTIDPLTNKIDGIDKRLTGIETKVGNLDTKVGSLETDMKDVKREVVKTNLTIERTVYPMIQAIREGQIINREKLAEVNATVDDMASTVLALDILHTKK